MAQKTVVPPRSSILLSIIRWIDTHAGNDADAAAPPAKKSVDWVRTAPFLAMHAACLGVIWVGWSWTAVAVAAALYAIRMFAVTGFYHRYFSHRTYTLSRFWQFIFALVGSTCVQRGPLWWAAHHRHHHRHSDEEDDVHSPVQHGFYWAHMGWITARSNFRTDLSAVPDLAKYPELMFLDRFDTLVPVLLAGSLFSLGGLLSVVAPGLGVTAMQMLEWGFFISTVVLFHATCTINSLSHRVGRKRFHTGDESRNSLLLALLTFGEGWHNNHHHYPASVRQGFYWWEVDLTYYGLKMLSWLGVIRDLRPVPDHARESRRVMVAEAAATA